jgi:hypothetical protein
MGITLSQEEIHPVMRSSSTISLFSERPEPDQRPYSFLISILVHGATIGLISLGILSAPRIKTPTLAQRYAVRHLNLNTLEPRIYPSAALRSQYLRSHALAPAATRVAAQPPVLRLIAKAAPGPQTLLQPDIPMPAVLPAEVPVPTVIVWSGKNTSIKTLIAPMQEKPPVTNIAPSVQLPNEEQQLSEIALAASNLPAPAQPIRPSTTSPVVAQGAQPTPPAAITTTAGSAQSTPAAVISLSDLKMANGSIALPPVNETASSVSSGALAPRQDNTPAQPGNGNSAGAVAATAAGRSSRDAGDPTRARAANGTEAGSRQGDQPSTTHISVPKDGQFGAVVVGSSMEEKYPETTPLWSGRLAFTVYLHVGLAKSWILQYSLPRGDEAAQAGVIARLEAPWPYNIVLPNIPPGVIDADALMVHGFVNQAGRFEALAIAFPPQFEQTRFVLDSLAQWQFRPATQNGQNVKVEVLLIIPEVQE